MGLSSNTLIHLTKTKKNLLGILKSGFRVYYCSENVRTKVGIIEGAFPMVCFSDIPLSELKNQITSYGNYGIGLKKEWAIKNRLNPVLYFDDNSRLIETMGVNFKTLFERSENKEPKLFESLIHILSYAKNYEGELKKKSIKNYRFSDEREWRFVPYEKQLNGCKSWIEMKEYDTKEKKKNANEKINSIVLKFSIEDINYVFVKNENQISETRDFLRKLYKNVSLNAVNNLKIFDCKQIKTDM